MKHLDFDDVEVSDAFIKTLKENKGLKYLRIKIQQEQVYSLYIVLSENHTLKLVDILSTKLTLEQSNLLNSLKHITFYTYDDRI